MENGYCKKCSREIYNNQHCMICGYKFVEKNTWRKYVRRILKCLVEFIERLMPKYVGK